MYSESLLAIGELQNSLDELVQHLHVMLCFLYLSLTSNNPLGLNRISFQVLEIKNPEGNLFTSKSGKFFDDLRNFLCTRKSRLHRRQNYRKVISLEEEKV